MSEPTMRVETCNSRNTILETEDKLAEFRQQVKNEDESRPKMSEAAKAKLRSINERDRLNTDTDTGLVKEFTSSLVTLEQLVDLFAKSFGGTQQTPRRRAIKAMHRLSHGVRIYNIHDLTLLGELISDEAEMPMNRFLEKYPLPEDEMVTPTGELVVTPPVRRCALKQKCLRVKGRQVAEVTGRGQYCSPGCIGRAKMIAKLAQRASAQP
jgi:hypothetical protein